MRNATALRLAASLIALAATGLGCTDDNPSFSTTDEAGTSADQAIGGGGGDKTDLGGAGMPDLGGTVAAPDLSMTVDPDKPDLADPLAGDAGGGGNGAPCKTACDCMPGLACGFNGQCQKGFGGPVYCCEGQCPNGSYCQDRMGDYHQCGGAPDLAGVPQDMGATGPFWCQYVPCQNDQICRTAGCGHCDNNARSCR